MILNEKRRRHIKCKHKKRRSAIAGIARRQRTCGRASIARGEAVRGTAAAETVWYGSQSALVRSVFIA